jgi:hypothetical protein
MPIWARRLVVGPHTHSNSCSPCMFSNATKDARPHVMWVDNFNKSFRTLHVTTANSSYRQMNWCGEAIHACRVPHVSMSFQLAPPSDPVNAIIPAMPNNLFESVPWLVEQMNACDSVGCEYYAASLVLLRKVNCIPLKVIESTPSGEAVPSNLQSLDPFYPTGLLTHNPGDNLGLWSYMVRAYTQTGGADATQYHVYKMDSNIFQRWMKVIGNEYATI